MRASRAPLANVWTRSPAPARNGVLPYLALHSPPTPPASRRNTSRQQSGAPPKRHESTCPRDARVLQLQVMKMGPRAFLSGVVLCIGCSSSSSSPSANLNNFTGAAWSGTATTTFNCRDAGSTLPASGSTSFVLSASGSNGLTYTTMDGCVFDFTVSGDTATLSNAPVTCSLSTDAGIAVVLDVSNYTLSTSDGQHLAGTASGTGMVGGISCNLSQTLSATR
jgi:hypothetical protein